MKKKKQVGGEWLQMCNADVSCPPSHFLSLSLSLSLSLCLSHTHSLSSLFLLPFPHFFCLSLLLLSKENRFLASDHLPLFNASYLFLLLPTKYNSIHVQFPQVCPVSGTHKSLSKAAQSNHSLIPQEGRQVAGGWPKDAWL